MNKIKVIAVAGPTASGKTALAAELAVRLGGEIISADSMQVYKGMDIATAKPSAEEMRGIPHHLINILSPEETFSVADFKTRAQQAIADIAGRNKLPIIAGGTGLYINSLLENICFFDNTYNEEVRQKLQARLEKEGSEKLYQELVRIDKTAAEKIHANNSLKVIRALEIYYNKGKTLTEQNLASRTQDTPYDSYMIGLTASDRQFLYGRINRRADEMIRAGLVDEAKAFYSNKDAGFTSVQAIGYKEIKPYLDGEISLEEAVEHLKQASRRYAKRQLTWFRRNENMHWMAVDQFEDFRSLADEAERNIRRFLER